MKRSIIGFVICLMFCVVACQQQQPATLVLTNVTLIDGTGAPPQSGVSIVIVDELISAVGSTDKIEIPRKAIVVDASGKYIIPGLWDMHVHFYAGGADLAPLFIANGVTSVRDMGGDFVEMEKIRSQIQEGTLIGPRIKMPGPMLESARWITMVEKLLHKPLLPKRIGVEKPEEAAEKVNALAAMGIDFVKIRTCASKETYYSILAAAKSVNLHVVGHLPMMMTLAEVSDAGQRSIEHNFFTKVEKMNEEARRELIAKLKENETVFVPTLVADQFRLIPLEQSKAILDDSDGGIDFRRQYVPKGLLDFWEESISLEKYNSPMDWKQLHENGNVFLSELHRAGVKILAGTDIGVPLGYPGFSLHEELQHFVEKIGMTPMEAIESATRLPSEFMGMDDSLGTLEAGKTADLIVLDENPLTNIANTLKINAVVVGGILYIQSDLQEMLASVKQKASQN
ncbi:amidohydrolase family protein [Acidobacteriota bacterium]